MIALNTDKTIFSHCNELLKMAMFSLDKGNLSEANEACRNLLKLSNCYHSEVLTIFDMILNHGCSLNYYRESFDYINSNYSELEPETNKKVATVPSVVIETMNYCNFNCVMCEAQLSTRKKQYMSSDDIYKIIDDAANAGVTCIEFHTINEPTLDNRLVEIINYIKTKKLHSIIATNGSVIIPFITSALQKKLDNFSLHFSIDGATKKTYEAIRRGGNFDILLKNAYLTKQLVESNHSPISLHVNYSLTNQTISELTRFYSLFYGVFSENISLSLINSLSPLGNNNSIFSEVTYRLEPNRPCNLPFSGLWFLSNGEVSACCRDYNGEVTIGNASKTSITELWTGERINQLRQHHINHDATNLPKLCQGCMLPNRRLQNKINFASSLISCNKVLIPHLPLLINHYIIEQNNS